MGVFHLWSGLAIRGFPLFLPFLPLFHPWSGSGFLICGHGLQFFFLDVACLVIVGVITMAGRLGTALGDRILGLMGELVDFIRVEDPAAYENLALTFGQCGGHLSSTGRASGRVSV